MSLPRLPGSPLEPDAPAFVPCPAVLLTGVPEAHLQQLVELYRLARERAEAQSRRRPALPTFSLN